MSGGEGLTGRSAEARLVALEAQRRRVDAEITALLDDVERSGVYTDDGHQSVRSWAMATTGWSRGEATLRVRVMHALRDLPSFAQAHTTGSVPTGHLHTVARVWGNERVRDQLPQFDELLCSFAQVMRHDDFTTIVRRWEANADADGALRDHEDADRARHVSLRLVGNEYLLRGSFGTTQGALIAEVLDAYTNAEFTTDQHGGDECPPRTTAQRRADALFAICQAAVNCGRGVEVTLNVSIDQDTFTDQVTTACGESPDTPDPVTWFSRHCHTTTNTPLDPRHVLALATTGWVRRRLVDAAGVTVDLGRRRRLFTGAARDALRLAGNGHCVWPGCTHTITQADHIHPHSDGGPTDQSNAALLCGHHNRFKHHGYHLTRGPHGTWHTLRPDGTKIGHPDHPDQPLDDGPDPDPTGPPSDHPTGPPSDHPGAPPDPVPVG